MLATQTEPAPTPRPSERQGEARPSDALGVLEAVLVRLTEVMGPGALLALMRYGSQAEGARLAEARRAAAVPETLARVGEVIGVRVESHEVPGGVSVRVRAPTGLDLSNAGVKGLVAGLLEGALGAVDRTGLKLAGDPVTNGEGVLRIEFKG